ncbi:hypothetical protein SNE35_09755 [Paucibacter sp. R3-3]|uniref:Uncharacterized protein n=1 Tax=Roseateles agri TaxID=3098619 RepID=A0ABU5DEU4_9BURK|nr:hypothetical protein [Paucibacter sp. R3-3]MDY0744793.1 hypothetical protein [Paucibacter sp. R3-3]
MSRVFEAIAAAPLAVVNAIEFLGRRRGDDDITAEWRARWRAVAGSSLAVLLAFGVAMFAAPMLDIVSPGAAPIRDVLAWLLMAPMLAAMTWAAIAALRVWLFEREHFAQ